MGLFNVLGRGAVGAGAGLYAGWNDGSRGRLGGMAAGALAGMTGPAIGRRLYGMNNWAGKGLRAVGGGIGTGMNWAGSKLQSFGSGTLSNLALGAKSNYVSGLARRASAGTIGMGNALSSNKYGGKALLGLGMLSAGSIGATTLRSNSRY